MPRWFDVNPEGPVTSDDFMRFDAIAGYPLPVLLREHLEVANGGYSEPNGYVVPHPDGRIDVHQVDCFLALHGNHWDGELPDAYRRRPLLDVAAQAVRSRPAPPPEPAPEVPRYVGGIR